MRYEALVIGGTGLVGRGVALELVGAGKIVTVAARGSVRFPNELSGCETIQVDRAVPGALREAIGERHFDLVVDCAAYSADDVEDAVGAFGGRTAHYFFISSDFVYAANPAARHPLREDAATQRGLPYARRKLEAESVLVAAFRESEFPATILRPPHVLGAGRAPGCDPAAGGRDPSLPERIRAGEEIPLLAGGQFLIQPVWSREIGRCIAALSGNKATFGGIFNLPGAECVTTRHYYETVAAELGAQLRIRSVDVEDYLREDSEKAHLARHRIYDGRRLEAAGYRPTLELRDALSETLAWLEGNEEGGAGVPPATKELNICENEAGETPSPGSLPLSDS